MILDDPNMKAKFNRPEDPDKAMETLFFSYEFSITSKLFHS
jgi:hypothetical protein